MGTPPPLPAGATARPPESEARRESPLGRPVGEAAAIRAEPASPPAIKPVGPIKSTPQQAVAPANQGGPPAREPLRDPVARVALALVGTDPEAEAYWYEAINDPSLSAHEREDLIEDLNEEGLPDPKHPTADDLPLIVSRLMVIEEAGPYAMDKVNADAFQEAYKDLVNLANVAMGGGEPVR